MKQKTLIIKTGWSETIASEASRKCSLGDVFRTTCILHKMKDDRVTWLTDEKAVPLLKGNPLIERIMTPDLLSFEQLKAESFDTIINLEKIPGLCGLTQHIQAWKKLGFRMDSDGEIQAYDRSLEVLQLACDDVKKKENTRCAQELLFEAIGEKFAGEEYVLGYHPKSKVEFDCGFNSIVGEKFTGKAWVRWEELASMLGGIRSVTRQDKQPAEMFEDIEKYIDWINSCKVLVTSDSLGLHLGLALKKKVIGIFGSTSDKEIYFYNRGVALVGANNETVNVTPERVIEEIKRLIG